MAPFLLQFFRKYHIIQKDVGREGDHFELLAVLERAVCYDSGKRSGDSFEMGGISISEFSSAMESSESP